ncbi:MAG: hypothetical protein PHY45_12465 [Rhodocyclaceae bacterium]|nr:hypothetical protein [Rhodocyclaceae bacterium]
MTGRCRAAAGLLLALGAATALACGHCIEDRVAAVYDYGVAQQAGREGLRVAYLGIAGRSAETAAAAAATGDALRGIAGVAPGTLRVAAAPAAAAFAWSGDEAALARILQTANRRLVAAGLRLELLRVWEAGRGLVEPPPRGAGGRM